jgi:hypothetical protein
MTNLPAMIETEALTYAKECVRFMHTDSLRTSGYSWFSKEGSRRLSRRVLKAYAMTGPFTMDEMVTCAMAGWHDAHEALGELISEFHARGQQLPPQLAFYDVHAWNQRLSSSRGRRKSDNATRNICIASIVDVLCKRFGLKATRNRQSKRPERRQSAAGILAQALKEELPHECNSPTDRSQSPKTPAFPLQAKARMAIRAKRGNFIMGWAMSASVHPMAP